MERTRVDMATRLDLDTTMEQASFELANNLGGTSDGVRSRVSLGRTVGVKLTPERVQADPGLTEYLSMERDASFFAVGFACSFFEREGERVEDAQLSVELSSTSGPPIAWSMDPVRLARKPAVAPTKVDAKTALQIPFEFGPKLELAVSADVNVSDKWYVLASGLRESVPDWQLRRVAGQDLDGYHELKLIVRAPHDAVITVRSELTATIGLPRAVVFARAKRQEVAGQEAEVLVLR
jgi:hypothetical protein